MSETVRRERTEEERRLIARAKRCLMRRHRWDEPTAYKKLRDEAMCRRLLLTELAQRVLEGRVEL